MMNFHSQWVVMLSMPECTKSIIGTRLVRKAVLTVCVIVVGEFWKFFDSSGSSIGVRIVASVRSIAVLRSSVVSITFTRTCTKMDGS